MMVGCRLLSEAGDSLCERLISLADRSTCKSLEIRFEFRGTGSKMAAERVRVKSARATFVLSVKRIERNNSTPGPATV